MHTVLFMRHEQSEANAQGVSAGTSDSPLTEKGRANARLLAQKLKNRGVTRIVTSHLSRACETAEIIADALRVPVTTFDTIHEVDVGEFTNTASPKSTLQRAIESVKGESAEAIEARARQLLNELQRIPDGETVLVVSHKNFIAATFAVAEGVPPEKFIPYRDQWRMENGEVKTLTLP